MYYHFRSVDTGCVNYLVCAAVVSSRYIETRSIYLPRHTLGAINIIETSVISIISLCLTAAMLDAAASINKYSDVSM